MIRKRRRLLLIAIAGVAIVVIAKVGHGVYLGRQLHGPARRGDVATVRLLLAKGANVNARSIKGQTPLHVAAWDTSDDFAAVGSIKGQTPLHVAAAAGRTDVARVLLDHGADPRARARSGGDTPLEDALIAHHFKTARLIRDRGMRTVSRSATKGPGRPGTQSGGIPVEPSRRYPSRQFRARRLGATGGSSATRHSTGAAHRRPRSCFPQTLWTLPGVVTVLYEIQ